MNPDHFNCGACQCDPVTFEMSYPKWKIPGVIESKKCLAKMITTRDLMFIKMWRFYRLGVLPVDGGLLDQPNVFIEAMNTIEGYKGPQGK